MNEIKFLVEHIRQSPMNQDIEAKRLILKNPTLVSSLLEMARQSEDIPDLEELRKLIRKSGLSREILERGNPQIKITEEVWNSPQLAIEKLIAASMIELLILEAAETTPERKARSKRLSLTGDSLSFNGKPYPLKPNAAAMWRKFFEYNGAPLHQADFPGFEARKVINEMPDEIQKLIVHGKPHQGYAVPRLRKSRIKL